MAHGCKRLSILRAGVASVACAWSLAGATEPGTRASGANDGNAIADAKAASTASKIYQYRVGGVTTFSDLPPQKGAYIIWRPSCFACKVASSLNWHSVRLHASEYADVIERAARLHEVDPALVRAVIHAESDFNPHVKSSKGACGLMQLMPGTAHSLGVHDVFLPATNIAGGVQYLAGLLKEFKGSLDLALAAYNAGPQAVNKYGTIPPYAETQVYVERVKILHQRYRQLHEG